MARRKTRPATTRSGGGVGDRRVCSAPSCRVFLPPDRKDHYCLACRAEKRRQRRRYEIEREKRFLGHTAPQLLQRYFA